MNTHRLLSSFAAGALLALPAVAQTWSTIATANHPAPRSNAAMAYDDARDRVVLHGGNDGQFWFTDTWEWDGTDWTHCTPLHSPVLGVDMCYDRARHRTVMVGGFVTVPKTWEWDGTDWTSILIPQPPLSGNDLVAWDGAHGVTVLFIQGNGAHGGETWHYDGVAWTLQVANTAMRQAGSRMVFDPLRARVVLQCGTSLSPAYPDGTTWEYDGTTWTPRTDIDNPVASDFAFAWDPHRRCGVAVGGVGSYGMTGEYAPWCCWGYYPGPGPTGRAGSSMVYDSLRERCFLFGGRDLATNARFADSLCFVVPTGGEATPFGQGCAGTVGTPGFAPLEYHRPVLGYPFTVRIDGAPANMPSFVAFGSSNTTAGGLPLPLSLQFLGMTNCTLYTSAEFLLAAATSGTSATWTLPLPSNGALYGVHFYLQGVVLDPGANPGNLIVTRALACRIGW